MKEISRLCDIAIGTAHKWVDEKGLESEKDGRERAVRLADLLVFLAKRYANESSEFQERLRRAQAERAEFENSIRRGEFMPIVAHGELLRKVVAEIVPYGGITGTRIRKTRGPQ